MSMPQETPGPEDQASRDESERLNSSDSFVLMAEAHRSGTSTTGTRTSDSRDKPAAGAAPLVPEEHVNAEAAGWPPTGTRRVNVNFAPSAYATLDRLAARKGKTMSEILRDAIQLEAWLANAEDDGWHVLLERDGRVRELVRP